MKFDVIGRMRNMRLPDGKAAILYSVYEAVSNAIHAIQDRFGEDKVSELGEVEIDVGTDSEGHIDSISIADNGTGLDNSQLDAFETYDSRFKQDRGGKGIGRLIWVKVFETITVHTRFRKGKEVIAFTFDFLPTDEKSIGNKRLFEDTTLIVGTKIVLRRTKTGYREKVRKISFLRDLALHFFACAMPKLTVIHNGSAETFSDFVKDKLRTGAF